MNEKLVFGLIAIILIIIVIAIFISKNKKPTPTPTQTPTPTPTPTRTPSHFPTRTPSPTSSPTPSPIVSPFTNPCPYPPVRKVQLSVSSPDVIKAGGLSFPYNMPVTFVQYANGDQLFLRLGMLNGNCVYWLSPVNRTYQYYGIGELSQGDDKDPLYIVQLYDISQDLDKQYLFLDLSGRLGLSPLLPISNYISIASYDSSNPNKETVTWLAPPGDSGDLYNILWNLIDL